MGYNVDFPETHRRAPLVCCGVEGHLAAVLLLRGRRGRCKCVDVHGAACDHNGIAIPKALVGMAADLKAHTNTGNTPLHKVVYVGNLLGIRLFLNKGVTLERSPRDSTRCGQNSPATCTKGSRSPRVRTATLEHALVQHLRTRQCRKDAVDRSSQKPSFLLVGAAVRNRSYRLWSGMAGIVIGFVCRVILEDSIRRSLSHCVYWQFLKWTRTQVSQYMRLAQWMCP